MTSTALSFKTVIVKVPSFFVAVVLTVPFSRMLAPESGVPFSSTTFPFTTWAKGAFAKVCSEYKQKKGRKDTNNSNLKLP